MSQDFSNIIYYGDSSEVNSVEDYNDHVKLESKNQNLPGFDKEYADFIQYILVITHRIWEEKGIGVIYDTYHNNVVMHFGAFNAVGIQGVIAGTLATLYSFPDRRLIGQDVIWSPHGAEGFLSSHRIISTATNLNDSSFGPATGKKVSFRTAVDCAAEHNRIYEEWLVRDNLWIVKQLGYNPHEVAKRMAGNKNAHVEEALGLHTNMKGQLMPVSYKAKDETVGELMLELLYKIYGARRFNEVCNYYHDNAVVHFVCDKDLVGHSAIQGMLINLFSAFPNANYLVERITCNQGKEDNTWKVAVRWRLNGMHEGLGMFGPASGASVQMLGISHFHIRNNQIEEEWVTFDGLDVLRQIYSNSYIASAHKGNVQKSCCSDSKNEPDNNSNIEKHSSDNKEKSEQDAQEE